MKSVHLLIRAIILGLVLIGLGACASRPTINDNIIGTWRGEVGGVSATLVFDEARVSIEGFGMQMPYNIKDGILSIRTPSQGTMQYRLRIEEGVMFQEDVHSDLVFQFTRLN